MRPRSCWTTSPADDYRERRARKHPPLSEESKEIMLRCRPGTAFYLGSQGFTVEHKGKRVLLSKPALDLLSEFADWRDESEVITQYPSERADAARKALVQLAGLGLIEPSGPEGTCGQSSEASDAGGWIPQWGAAARSFHEASRDAPYVDDREERADLVRRITSVPGPDLFKDYGKKPTIPLPTSPVPLSMPLGEALLTRRTHRDFTGQPVTVQQLATVLHYTFRPQGFINGGPFGLLLQKVSPSAGARHEAECYVAARNVDDVNPGLYHYNGKHHSLTLIGEAPSDTDLAYMTYNQRQCYSSPFTCFTTAVFPRLAYKNRHARSYLLWMYDAGHYGQTFALACAALGLGAYQTAAFRDSEVERYLDVHGTGEFAAYVLGAGHPADGKLAEAGDVTGGTEAGLGICGKERGSWPSPGSALS
jgi:SagB-type dehydrogenase family enzyme